MFQCVLSFSALYLLFEVMHWWWTIFDNFFLTFLTFLKPKMSWQKNVYFQRLKPPCCLFTYDVARQSEHDEVSNSKESMRRGQSRGSLSFPNQLTLHSNALFGDHLRRVCLTEAKVCLRRAALRFLRFPNIHGPGANTSQHLFRIWSMLLNHKQEPLQTGGNWPRPLWWATPPRRAREPMWFNVIWIMPFMEMCERVMKF